MVVSFIDSYLNSVYYTYIGEVCVSVNPNRSDLTIYGADYMQLYYGKKMHELPPHIFAIAGSAYQHMYERCKDSCVIITGVYDLSPFEWFTNQLTILFISSYL